MCGLFKLQGSRKNAKDDLHESKPLISEESKVKKAESKMGGKASEKTKNRGVTLRKNYFPKPLS